MMNPTDPEFLDPVHFAGGVLDRFRHVCAFVNGPAEQEQFVDPFVIEGLERGENVLFLVDPAERGERVNHLRRLGLDMPALLEQRRCELRTWTETYLRGGNFDPFAMLDLLDEFLLGAPSPRIRMIAEMSWANSRDEIGAQLIEFEARANFVHAQHQHVVICVYDVSKFDGAFVLDILRTHPMVLIGGMLQLNPFFFPPEAFLDELKSRARPHPEP
jgi:hypothetical protein